MATPTIHTKPSPKPILTSGPYLIVSTDAEAAGIGRLAFSASGLPPSGNVTLQTSVGDPLLNPTLLWFPVAVSATVFQIISYVTVGNIKPLALTGGTAANATITVAALDPGNPCQLWDLVDPPNETTEPTLSGFVLKNCGANGAAIRRSTFYPVPGTTLQLAVADTHTSPFYYQFVKASVAPADLPVSTHKPPTTHEPVVQQTQSSPTAP